MERKNLKNENLFLYAFQNIAQCLGPETQFGRFSKGGGEVMEERGSECRSQANTLYLDIPLQYIYITILFR